MRTPVSRCLLAGVALLSAVVPALAADAVQSDPPAAFGSSATDPQETTYDVRRAAGRVAPTTAQRDALARLVAGAPAGTRATWDSRFGTPRTIFSRAGSLSGPRAGAPADVARAWVDDNRAAFGLSAADVAALAVTRDHELPGTGAHVVTLTQVVGGVPAGGAGRLTVAVGADGTVLSYAGDPARGGALQGDWSRGPADALAALARQLGGGVAYTPVVVGQRAGFTEFARGPFAASSYVQRVAFPVADGARAAYRILFVERLDEAYDVVVDAASGEVLYRASLVEHEAEGTVYENFPGAPKGGQPVKKSFGPTAESPSGWVDPTGLLGLAGPTTLGNNADTYANYSNFLVPADQAPRPVSPLAQFNYPYEMNWQSTRGATLPPSYALDLDPAATNLFYHHNRIHDELYRYGFTETAGNFQADGGDPILGLVHAGAASGGAEGGYTGRDNAYMLTLPDGVPSWSGMFLWEPINDVFEAPYSDGNFDAGVIEHEYVHGLSTRYVGAGGGLNAHQSGSMGEGWSDWYALNYLYREGLQDRAVVGQYVTGNTTRGIRNWDYDQNPTGFGDVGYDLPGPEVHSDGEIWTAVLWDLRKALVAAYGPVQGGEVATRLVTDGMPLTPADPSMLDAREGILQADAIRYQQANRDLIWSVFARRGMGVAATTAGAEDIDPVPSYAHETAGRNGTLAGQVVNASTGAPVAGAKVFLGVFEARTTPVARSSSTGGFAVQAVGGTYPVTIQAPGFGAQTFEGINVAAGGLRSLAFSIAPNLVSLASGAQLVSVSSQDDGLPGTFLLDDTEASVWSTRKGATAYNAGPDEQVTVKLARPTTIASVQVSAFKNTTSPRFAAMRDFTVQVSDDGVAWKTVQAGAFSAPAPRPTAPDLHYRSFTLAKPVKAGYVRLVVNSVQGETVTFAQAAELQVFGKAKSVTPAAPPADPDFVDSGTLAVGNPSTGDPTGLQNVLGVTGNEMTNLCTMPPATQGVDGWITKLPPGFGDGTHKVSVLGAATPAGHDIDVYFLDSSCVLVGSAATPSPDETGIIPGSTVYVLSQLWSGAAVPFTLTATDAG